MLIQFDWILKESDSTLLEYDRGFRFFKSFKFQVDNKGGKIISFWSLELSISRWFLGRRSDNIKIKLQLEDASTTKYLYTTFDITFKSKLELQLCHVGRTHLFKKSSNISSETMYENQIPLHSCEVFQNKSHHPFKILCNVNTNFENETIDCMPGETFDVEKLLNDQNFSDFTIVTTTKQFKVHKMVLAAKSEVFSAMFEHDMLEKKKNSVSIENFDDEVIQELLRYMYCGRVVNLEKLSHSLLEAAAMYLVDGLKAVCLEYICEKVTFENALKILLLTFEHKIDYLKLRILNFIVYNIKYTNRVYLNALNDSDLLKEILEKTVKTHLHVYD